MIEQFFDNYGMMHHVPVIDGDPETSENAPMFYGIYITEKRELTEDDAWKYLAAVGFLYDPPSESWITTPVSAPEAGFSHDNFKGMVAGILTIKRKFKKNKAIILVCNGLLRNVPLFHYQLKHPRDFVWIGFAKYPYLFFWLLWIPMIAFLVSCFESYKYRNGNTIIKTEGKFSARVCCKSSNMKFTYWMCDKMFRRWRVGLSPMLIIQKWQWQSWFQVYAYYFKHPENPIVSEVWE